MKKEDITLNICLIWFVIAGLFVMLLAMSISYGNKISSIQDNLEANDILESDVKVLNETIIYKNHPSEFNCSQIREMLIVDATPEYGEYQYYTDGSFSNGWSKPYSRDIFGDYYFGVCLGEKQ